MTPESTRVWIVMPMYNELGHVGPTLRTLPQWVRGIVLVDDGSNDGSSEEVRNVADPRVHLIRHGGRRGVGAALRTGFRAVVSTDADVVVTMDSDGQMAVQDLPAMITPIATGRADYVKGSRFDAGIEGSGMPLVRRIANRVLSRHLASLTGDPRLSDAHCGYTAMTPRVAESLASTPLHRTYGVYNDILYRVLADHRNRVAYVPVQALYAGERSHLGWRDAVRLIGLTLALQIRGLRARHPVDARIRLAETGSDQPVPT